MIKLYGYLLFFLLSTISFNLRSQEKCGTVIYEQQRKQKSFVPEDISKFEDWLKSSKRTKDSFLRSNSEEEVYVIPVVVHVIHRGEIEGLGTNIPEQQVQEQIRILNEDFRRLNADASNTLQTFRNVAADARIEFVLALQSPEGLPTNGIVRVRGNKENYRITDNIEIKSYSYWPAEDYLNIWVAPLQGNLLGYAQFPVSSLEGLEDSSNNRLTDGVVVTYNYFGMGGNAASGSRGRTATHEIGHFFGLRHIWGDGDCSVDDFCNDTPNAEKENTGCPSSPVFSCGSQDMYQNYMDYTSDVCMNIFTVCQKERMRTVLENSPRRNSLLTSPGKIAPVFAQNDASIEEIISPVKGECSRLIAPVIKIRNTGQEDIHQVKIQLKVNGGILQTLVQNVALLPTESSEISFSSLNLGYNTSYNIAFEILEVNETLDENPFNNKKNQDFTIFQSTDLPIDQTFERFPEEWSLQNPDGLFTWEMKNAPFRTENNTSASINFYEYEGGLGEMDYLVTPEFDVSDFLSLDLKFNLAYARFPNNRYQEGLIIAVSTDCGNTFSEPVFSKFDRTLETAPSITSPFIPMGRQHWREEIIDLSAFAGAESLQIAFIGVNGYGNNLYIDDIKIEGERSYGLDIEITKILQPGFISCNDLHYPSVEIKNNGSENIHSFEISCYLDNGLIQKQTFESVNIAPGETDVIEFDELGLADRQYEIKFEIGLVNGRQDDNRENNLRGQLFYINQNEEILPYRASIGPDGDDWLIINHEKSVTWEVKKTTGARSGEEDNYSYFVNHYGFSETGNKNWLVSPIFDFSKVLEASLSFFTSYATFGERADGLRVLVSTDCGESFEDIVFSKNGSGLSSLTSDRAWEPIDEHSWKKHFVDLTDYVGQQKVRIAFESVNDHGNNLYLENIEMFMSGNDFPVPDVNNDFVIYPNPVQGNGFKLAFNLNDRRDLRVSLSDVSGKELFTRNFDNVLNQTFIYEIPYLKPGVYFVSASGGDFKGVKRVIVH